VYKGASFDIWVPDTGTYYAWADPAEVRSVLADKRARGARLARSPFSEFPARWVRDASTLPCLRPRIAFRDVTNRTNTRTVIAALVPPKVVITNKAPYLLWPRGDERDEAFLLGVLCSIPLDWYARTVVETNVNFHVFNGLPVPDADRGDPLRREVERLAGTLAAVDGRYEHWAAAVGVPVGGLEGEERADAVARLDAAVAHLYGLDADDLEVVYSTFHEGWDHRERLARVLAHHEELR
jgi:hypothetical protein